MPGWTFNCDQGTIIYDYPHPTIIKRFEILGWGDLSRRFNLKIELADEKNAAVRQRISTIVKHGNLETRVDQLQGKISYKGDTHDWDFAEEFGKIMDILDQAASLGDPKDWFEAFSDFRICIPMGHYICRLAERDKTKAVDLVAHSRHRHFKPVAEKLFNQFLEKGLLEDALKILENWYCQFYGETVNYELVGKLYEKLKSRNDQETIAQKERLLQILKIDRLHYFHNKAATKGIELYSDIFHDLSGGKGERVSLATDLENILFSLARKFRVAQELSPENHSSSPLDIKVSSVSSAVIPPNTAALLSAFRMRADIPPAMLNIDAAAPAQRPFSPVDTGNSTPTSTPTTPHH